MKNKSVLAYLAGTMGASLLAFLLWASWIPYKDSPPLLIGVMLFWAAIYSAGFGIVAASIPFGIWQVFKTQK